METGDFIVDGRKGPLYSAFSTKRAGRLLESRGPRIAPPASRCCQKTLKAERRQHPCLPDPFLFRLAGARFVVCIGALAQPMIFGGRRVVDEAEIRLYRDDSFALEKNFL